VLFSFSAMAGIFQGRVAGVVVDERSNQKISGVAITLQAKGIWKSDLPATQSNGHFDLDFEQIFPEVDLNRSTITLIFDKPGYDQLIMVLNTESDRENWDQLEIRLFKPQVIPAISAEEAKKIEKYMSQKGKTLYLFPYYLAKANDSMKLHLFAQNLLDSITASLKTTIQAAPSVEMDVSIQPLSEISITSTNIEQHHQIGVFLNALGMISGMGEWLTDGHGKEEVYLRSNYVTIPAIERFRPGSVTIKDQFPSQLLNSLQLSAHLNKYWGHHTALAICVQEFRRAMVPSKNEDQLRTVEKLIIASRSQLSGDNPQLSAQFDKLLDVVIEESNQ
jgi:hypothetical protein